jgi:hypothetical protein
VINALLLALPPFPYDETRFGYGYFTIFFPFLFIGVYFFLLEQKELQLKWFISLVSFVFAGYFYLISKYHPELMYISFAILGFLLFALAFILRNHLKENILISILSSLTFSVYLFHKWMFEEIKLILPKFFESSITIDLATLVLLFLLCFVMNKTIENGGIKLGNKLLQKIKNANY